ncbi:MAG: imidazolonepropionase [Limisphaerales bacterium]|jgi:imidazolonepropionase
MSLLIKNIGRLYQTDGDGTPGQAITRKIVKGADMKTVPFIDNAWVLSEKGHIHSFGSMDNCPVSADKVMDASGKLVLPSWCDSHTHLVYAHSREKEFVDRINGLTYEQIAENGGGILNSARKLQQSSEEDLLESAWLRLGEIMDFGTGAVEIKSGYGLTTDSELKMLRVAKKLKEISPVTIKTTFLGAHAFPTEYKKNREGYIKLIIEEMIPKVVDEGLADYIDVFCDKGFYTPEEADRILKAGIARGLRAKLHANELANSGGIQVGVANNAISVDHLEFTGDEEIASLLSGNTMPTLLPSTAFFLGLQYAPARKMIDAGLPVALASDYNPGTTPSGKIAFVLSLACLKMNMTPEEALNAVTVNSAKAMDLENECGSIAVGKKANFIITKKIPALSFIPYAFGSDVIESVIINGEIR